MTCGKWQLQGYDTFAEEFYPLEGEYDTEKQTMAVAEARLEELEATQPSEHSGGQGKFGIQDRVYIVRPDGTRYQYVRGDVLAK